MSAWQRIKFPLLARLIESVPARLRWRWDVQEQKGRRRLYVVSPRGVRWQFRMNGGAYIRRCQ